MSLETITREYWFASSFLKGRHVPRVMNRNSAESCLRYLASGCRWRSLRYAALGAAAGHNLLPEGVRPRVEWYLPCDTEPEAAP